jgi:hypothetical protein
MRHATRAPLRAAALLAAVAALTGCIRLGQPEQLPSPYAGTGRTAPATNSPTATPAAKGSCCPPPAAAATALPYR